MHPSHGAFRRHSTVIAAAAVSCLALLPVTSAQAAVRAPWATPRPGSTYSLSFRFQRLAGEPSPVASDPLADCEQKLEQAQRQRQRHDGREAHGVPALAIVGASFTKQQPWSTLLPRRGALDQIYPERPQAEQARADQVPTGHAALVGYPGPESA